MEGKSIGLVKSPTVAPSLGPHVLATRDSVPAYWSFQQVAGTLAGRHDVTAYNLAKGEEEIPLGQVDWNGLTLDVVAYGTSWEALDPASHDVWGVTCNYTQERSAALETIRFLAENGAKVVVGGSDAFYCPAPFFEAGATVVVRDKSGASNLTAIDCALGESPEGPADILLADGEGGYRPYREWGPPLYPDEWGLPPLQVAKASLSYTRASKRKTPVDGILSPFSPSGSIMPDQGCDRKCNFCGTPGYKLGYRYMSPARVSDWLSLQKEAGAKSVLVVSDQFLGRVLWDEGRDDVLETMRIMRDFELGPLWYNGIELSKLTVGRGFPKGDLRPDEELIEAMFGGGCLQVYVPGERPVRGPDAYQKLLPWPEHVEVVKAIARTGVPILRYGIIIGFPDDTHEELEYLFENLVGLRESLLRINPKLHFSVTPSGITSFPGTKFWQEHVDAGRLDPNLHPALTGKWTNSLRAENLAWWEIFWWQARFQQEFAPDGDMGAKLLTPKEVLSYL